MPYILGTGLTASRNLLTRIKHGAMQHKVKILIGCVAIATAFLGYRYYTTLIPKTGWTERLYGLVLGVTGLAATIGVFGAVRYCARKCSAFRPTGNEAERLARLLPKPTVPRSVLFLPPQLTPATNPDVTWDAGIKALKETNQNMTRTTAYRALNTGLDGMDVAHRELLGMTDSAQIGQAQEQLRLAEEGLTQSYRTHGPLTPEEMAAEEAIRQKLTDGVPLHIPQKLTSYRLKSDLLWIKEILSKRIVAIRMIHDPATQVAAVESLWLMLKPEYREALLANGDDEYFGALFQLYSTRYQAQIATFYPTVQRIEEFLTQILQYMRSTKGLSMTIDVACRLLTVRRATDTLLAANRQDPATQSLAGLRQELTRLLKDLHNIT